MKILIILSLFISPIFAWGTSANEMLIFAAKNCRADLIRDALNAGANVNTTDPESGRSPLSFAANCIVDMFHREAPELLLSSGADINQRDLEGRTPLFYAVDAKVVSSLPQCWSSNLPLFLERGANPLLLDNNGESVLFRALKSDIRCAWQDNMGVLKKYSLDWNVKNHANEGLLMVAIRNADSRADIYLEALIQQGARPDDLSFFTMVKELDKEDAWYALHAEMVATLFQNANEFKSAIVDENGSTALHVMMNWMTWENKGHEISKAIAKGVAVLPYLNIQDAEGNTPLMVYVSAFIDNKNFELPDKIRSDVLRTMISRGVNVNLRNKHGLTALGMVNKEHSAFQEFAWILEQAGAVE